MTTLTCWLALNVNQHRSPAQHCCRMFVHHGMWCSSNCSILDKWTVRSGEFVPLN